MIIKPILDFAGSKPKLQHLVRITHIDFLCSKVSGIAIMSLFLHPGCIKYDIDERTVFVRRVCQEKEKKLKEFNFKVLHGILPCGVNLKKWKISNTNM